ncbi:MAG: hypothetical protein D3904_05235 [Candidatus Electrothrix sp. EH2]|nr:hypothetical protein [Candidatus Electrothrix sp. EH2]
MKKYTRAILINIVLASCAFWGSNSFAALAAHAIPDLSGLTVEEAHAKYGVGSGFEHPLVLTVNAKLGQQKCVSIGPDCSIACPKAKIYAQSQQHYLNSDGSRTLRVDVYYDINEAITSRKPSC